MGAPYDIDDTIRLGAPYDINATVRLGAPYDIITWNYATSWHFYFQL
jgi:hypothetical protein